MLKIGPQRAAAVSRIFAQTTPDGRTVATLDRSEHGGFVLDTPGFGRFSVSENGEEVTADPQTAVEWRWQRMLLGHAVPLAAVLRGVEILHASAVVLPGGRAIGIVAPSFGGKTSLAVQLVRRGAGFLSDDALCVRLEKGRPVVEPGGGTATVRNHQVRAIESDGRGWPGRVIARDEDSVRLAMPRATATPLAAVYFLRRTDAVAATVIETLRPEPRRLLAANFNFALRSPERMVRQLDACAAIAATCALREIHVPLDVSAAALAERLMRSDA